MSKTVIRITPVGGFDIPGLENWFAVMAGKGLRFSMTTGPLTIFEKTAATNGTNPFRADSRSSK